jgi:hypothetical protein
MAGQAGQPEQDGELEQDKNAMMCDGRIVTRHVPHERDLSADYADFHRFINIEIGGNLRNLRIDH